eukprot:492797-Hanusia_phi.AAC.1
MIPGARPGRGRPSSPCGRRLRGRLQTVRYARPVLGTHGTVTVTAARPGPAAEVPRPIGVRVTGLRPMGPASSNLSGMPAARPPGDGHASLEVELLPKFGGSSALLAAAQATQ